MNTKEALHKIDQSVIFREVFNDEASTRRNGGVPTDVIFQDGKGVFNGSSKIEFSFKDSGYACIRVKFNINSFTANQMLIDGRSVDNLGAFYIYINTIKALVFQDVDSIYVNGIDSTFVVSGDNELCINAPIDNIIEFLTIGQTYVGTSGLLGNMSLIEIYNRTLSQEEAILLYKQRYHRKPVLDNSNTKLLLDLDTRQGVLDVKTGVNTGIVLTPNDISFKKIGSNYSSFYNGISSYISSSVDVINTKEITIFCWITIKEIKDSRIVSNEKFEFIINPYTNRIVLRSDGVTTANYVNEVELNKLSFFAVTRRSDGTVNLFSGNIQQSPIEKGEKNGGLLTIASVPFYIGKRSFGAYLHATLPKLTILEGIATLEEITNYWSQTKNMIG